MVKLEDVEGSLLQKPSDVSAEAIQRAPSTYKPLHSFKLGTTRSYQQQYGDMYFLRLTKIKPAVEKIASEAWEGTVIGGEEAKRVDRVLDVRQGELCWVAGTVYIDMPLKPNILEDVSKDNWISAPKAREKYFSKDGRDQIMLEDDSGRISLVGDLLKAVNLVTGCIIAVMGTENANGELEVVDVKFPDLAPQPKRWTLSRPVANGSSESKKEAKDEDEEMADTSSSSRIAIVSGLSFSDTDTSYAMELNLLLEYLLGEALDRATQGDISRINRLIIAGNSTSTDDRKAEGEERKSHKKYGYDASAYNPSPSRLLDEFLSELLPTMPITLLPGEQDPANAGYPQQPIHSAMYPRARSYAGPPSSSEPGWFHTVTNPWEAELDGWRVLGTGGQNIDDIFKYVESEDRLGMMEATCRWRCIAPTAPDTLYSYPFQDDDPFVMRTCPHLYFVGCQPEFSTKIIEGPDGQKARLITVPSFSLTHEVVLVDTETLDVTKVKIATT